MATAWNKGKTKETDPSVAKISATMKAKGLDNFLAWRNKMKEEGKIKSDYPPFPRDARLAELIGVVLGDGNIQAFPRTERLVIVGDIKKPEFIYYYADLIEELFAKTPSILAYGNSNTLRLTLYERFISDRLGIPTGDKRNLTHVIPDWINENSGYLIAFLRGLYEAEGCYCIHKPTYTYKLNFRNYNKSLLDIVFSSVVRLGFHPHRSRRTIQLSRRKDVEEFRSLISFRNYWGVV